MRILKFIALAALVAFSQTEIVSGSAVPERELALLRSQAERLVVTVPGGENVTGLYASIPVYVSRPTRTKLGVTSILTLNLPGGGGNINVWKGAFALLLDALNSHSSDITSVIIPNINVPQELRNELSRFVHELFDSTNYTISIVGDGSGIELSERIIQARKLYGQRQILVNSARDGRQLICRFLFQGVDQSDGELSGAISTMTDYDKIDHDILQRELPYSDLAGGAAGVHVVPPRSPPRRTSGTLANSISTPLSVVSEPQPPSRSRSSSPSVLRGSSLYGGLSGDAYVQQFGVRAPDQPQRMQLVGAEDEDMRQAIAMSQMENWVSHVQAEDDADVERAIRESQEVYEAMIASQIASLEANVLDDEAQILAEIEQFERMQALEQSTASGKSVVKNELARAMAESSREYNAYLMQKYLDYARAHDMTVTEVRELSRDPEALQKILAEESVDKSGKARSTPSHSRARRVSSEGVQTSANTGAAHLSPAANDDEELAQAIALSLHKSP